MAALEPCRADGETRDLRRLGSGIPALRNEVAILAMRDRVVEFEPAPFDETSFKRQRVLLVLRRELVAAYGLLDLRERFQRFASRMQRLAQLARELTSIAEQKPFVRFG